MNQANRSLLFLNHALTIAMLSGILVVLGMALFYQFNLHEVPCPLCLLQRVGFFGIALGLLLNLRSGYKPLHYSVILISALFVAFVALRQASLHIVPGTGAYGSAVFGLHLYIWSFLIAMMVITASSIQLGFSNQYKVTQNSFFLKKITDLLFTATFTILMINMITAYGECGFYACPDNPVAYPYLTILNPN